MDAVKDLSKRDALRAVTGQIDWWWRAIFRPRLNGLSDEEYLWEPVEGCWTIHPADGDLVRVDMHWPPPRPAPFTTIAWRMQHIGVGCLARRTAEYFPQAAPEAWDVERYAQVIPFPLTAAEAIVFLERWWEGWRRGVGELTDDDLWRPLGAVEGDFPEMQLGKDDPFIGLVLHQHRELMHHGAEINLLRDLYLARQPKDQFVTALLGGDHTAIEAMTADDPTVVDRYKVARPDLALRAAETGRPDVIGLVADLGFDLDDVTDGYSALHHVVAGGYLELVKLLIELGADPAAKDATYDADALGWAEFFHQDVVADFLRGGERSGS